MQEVKYFARSHIWETVGMRKCFLTEPLVFVIRKITVIALNELLLCERQFHKVSNE